MKKYWKFFALMIATISISGCVAVALAPFANGAIDNEFNGDYSSVAKKSVLFNASLKAINSKGGDCTNTDRETGIIRCGVSVAGGQAAYEIALQIDEDGSKSKMHVKARSASIFKLDLKRASEFGAELINSIEQQLGSKLQKL